MNHLIVFCHPNPTSFNAALLGTVQGALMDCGHSVRVTNLYEKGFDPVLSGADFERMVAGEMPSDIAAEQALVSWADNLVFIYPIWWFNQPAVLQGWINRVFSNGFAFTEEGTELTPLLGGRTAQLVVTFGGREQDILEALGSVDTLLAPMTMGTLGLVGIEPLAIEAFFEVPTISDAERFAMLERMTRIIRDRYANPAVTAEQMAS